MSSVQMIDLWSSGADAEALAVAIKNLNYNKHYKHNKKEKFSNES